MIWIICETLSFKCNDLPKNVDAGDINMLLVEKPLEKIKQT